MKFRIAIIAFIIVMVFGVSGCMDINESTNFVSDIENFISEDNKRIEKLALDYLELKYDTDFQILKIGERTDSDSTKLYACPKSDTSVVFCAVADSDNNVTDNYMNRKMSKKIGDQIAEALESRGIVASLSSVFIGDKTVEYTTEDTAEYVKEGKVESIFIYLVLKADTVDKKSSQIIVDELKKINETYNISVAIKGVTIDEKYYECSRNMINEPEISSSWFNMYKPVSEFSFAIKNGRTNVSVDSLSEKIVGGE